MLSEQIIHLIESIGDHLNLETEFGYNDDTKDRVKMLEWELGRVLPRVRDMEAREDKQLEERFSLEISAIVDNAEDIIGGLNIDNNISYPQEEVNNEGRRENLTNPTASIFKLTALIHRIDGFYKAISSTPIYSFSTGNIQNFGHQQMTGSINVQIDLNAPPLIRRVAGRQSYGYVQNCDLVGFRWETETLLDQLIRNDQTRVVGIVGMGGSGKTTLAKHLYHHNDVKNHFAHKVWICVSRSWNRRDLLYEIFRQTQGAWIGRHLVVNWRDEEFAENLYQYLSTRLYLVVLDDVWAVDAWNSISPALPLSEGSKFLITTRNETVPKLVDPAFFVLEPKPLNPYESFELFCKRAFTNENPPSECVNLGIDMVNRCKGLPLAITALAGALRSKKSPSDWMVVSKTLTQRIMKTEDSTTQGVVNEVLALSYHDLPYYLKPCFLYVSIFPEGHVIQAKTLMRIWIAECLISNNPLYEEETMLRAQEYLDELIQRYIVQEVTRNYLGQVKTFQIHDLIREMCDKNARERGFLKKSHRVSLRISELQAEKQRKDNLSSFYHPANCSRLRSLIVFSPKDRGRGILPNYEHKASMLDMWFHFSKFKLLRVVILWLEWIYDCPLPEAIGELIHLRYLGLSKEFGVLGERYVKLSESMGNLCNLLTLDLKDFASGGLSKSLWKLKNLRHLYYPFHMKNYEPDDDGKVWHLDQ